MVSEAAAEATAHVSESVQEAVSDAASGFELLNAPKINAAGNRAAGSTESENFFNDEE